VVRAMPGAEAAEAALPKALARDLPNFMCPRQLHWRRAMPIGPNGKIDRAGLYAEVIKDIQP